VTKKRSQSSAIAIARKAGLTPLEPYVNANEKWKCRCNSCQKTVYPRFTHLINGGKGCRSCGVARGGKKIRISEAEAKKRLNKAGFKPLVKYPGSHFKWKSQCINCKSVVFPKLNQIASGKSGGCPKCGQVKRSNKLRLDESEVNKILKKHGFIPMEPYKSALSKWTVKHLVCNSKVSIKLNSLTSMGSGCPACAGRQVVIGFNDLKTTHPELAKELVDKDSREITAGSNSFAIWKCKLGHTWKSRVSDRSSKLTKCPFCSNKRLLSGFNDFATHYPELAMEAYGWDPSKLMRYAVAKKKWKCLEGHIWTTSVATRSSGSGCPKCADYGFIGSNPGYVYLLYHDVWEMLQIGITNHPKQRLKKHSKLGWIQLDMIGPMKGERARDLETQLLRAIKAKGIEIGKSTNKNRFDGYSESWNANGLKVKSINELLNVLSINLNSR
jgi:predicted RNA binding protein YcfA (HicA-like mRNA interferase family)